MVKIFALPVSVLLAAFFIMGRLSWGSSSPLWSLAFLLAGVGGGVWIRRRADRMS
jgi:MYXO-CTERM domain-containing protein